MEKQKRWQKYLIITVLVLTVYNILPTLFFYTKPLKAPVDSARADKISEAIFTRVNSLEDDAKKWLASYCKLLNIKPQSIGFDAQNPQYISLTFKNSAEADKLRTNLPRAGSLIPFVPGQLSVYDTSSKESSKTVVVQRKIPVHLTEAEKQNYFQFSEKFDKTGSPTPLYRALIFDRALQVGLAVGGISENGQLTQAAIAGASGAQGRDLLLRLAHNIQSFVSVSGEQTPFAKRYFASFSQVDTADRSAFIQNFLSVLEQSKDQVRLERIALQSEAQTLQAQGTFLDTVKQQKLEQLLSQEKTLSNAETIVRRNTSAFAAGAQPWHENKWASELEESSLKAQGSGSKVQTISLQGRNPFISALSINWSNETIDLTLQPDLGAWRKELDETGKNSLRDQLDQLVFNEIAYDARLAGEKITPIGTGFQISLSDLQGSSSFLALRLSNIAKARAQSLLRTLQENWHPKHPDLAKDVFPIMDYETYSALPDSQRALGLIVYAPASSKQANTNGFRMNSVYVIAKGLDRIVQRLNNQSQSAEAQQFFKDFGALRELLQNNDMMGYPGSLLTYGKQYAGDFIFEGEDYYQTLVKATREDFAVRGTKRYGVLELSNVQQRILTENKIDNHIHEDLLKWRDDYHAAQLGLGGATPYDVPKPTQNAFLSNMKLSLVKYFRGDDRKILHWGLDLSGGKTIQLELRDQNNRVVTNEDDLNQGINELYTRVNKMGVSEVSIRREGNFITLDFPGSQELSASELIKASTMYFHIANEKFGSRNTQLARYVTQFLQEVWNEAVVTGRKSAEDINQIAWKHLQGDSINPDNAEPRSESAKVLYDNGLRLASPFDSLSNVYNDALSRIAVIRGDSFTDWYGQTNPLMIIFHNYAVEGSNLKNVQAGYDPSKGNFLLFEIKGKETLKSGEKINARDDLYAWTSQFSKDKVAGTVNATYSQNEGWRMAVILNDSIITAPTLTFPIRDGGSIEGSFTQREVSKLEADLKAGSLSFTPHILSEKNVSPELGAHERMLGIAAMIVALILAIGTMISYYRFSGVVASVAILLNLLIIWATLQNLGATLTLATIAGVILTLALTADANVLVFERIREELAISGRLSSAINAGYRKAFSAIFDSNITTLIAALILLQFDSGPIKGFAVTLVIGVVSTLFTVLFMTRFFFAGWAQNPAHKTLKMSQLIKSEKFDFLKYAKPAFLISALIVVVGAFFLAQQRQSILGMDFTGGYALTIEVKPTAEKDLRALVETSLVKAGAKEQEFQVRQLTPETNLRIFISKSMQQQGRPFYGMPLHLDLKEYTYAYETNPPLAWVVNALNKQGLSLTAHSATTLDKNWSEVSGQLSDTMRYSAIIGLSLALLCILIYITIRFEFKYAISATLTLAHDLAITLGLVAILHALKVPVQIDLNTIAALLTIVGYSLNDTIIIFDRIREDLRLMRKSSFKEIIMHALNATLSRTLLTSGTTLLVLLPLVVLGGSTIFGFALVMIIGVVFGTLSSLFIAAPLLNYFHEKQRSKESSLPQVVV